MTLLHSRITGRAGHPVVLLGALGSSTDMWVGVQDALAATGVRTIALDHRGHGGSPTAEPSHTTHVADLAADVTETLDSMGVRSFDLVGLSIGGAVAQHLAADPATKDRVRALVLMCTGTTFGDAADWTTKAVAVRGRGSSTLQELSEGTVGRWLTGDFRVARPATALAVQEMITRTSIEGYAAACDALATFDGTPLLPQITCPTLTLAGTTDPTCPPATLETMNAAVGADGTPTRHAEIAGAHMLPVEHPAEVAEIVGGFLGAPRDR